MRKGLTLLLAALTLSLCSCSATPQTKASATKNEWKNDCERVLVYMKNTYSKTWDDSESHPLWYMELEEYSITIKQDKNVVKYVNVTYELRYKVDE